MPFLTSTPSGVAPLWPSCASISGTALASRAPLWVSNSSKFIGKKTLLRFGQGNAARSDRCRTCHRQKRIATAHILLRYHHAKVGQRLEGRLAKDAVVELYRVQVLQSHQQIL